MNDLVTDLSAIEHLDFPVPVKCVSKTCDLEAVALVMLKPSRTCHHGKRWWPICEVHKERMLSLNVQCAHCPNLLIITDIRSLIRSEDD